MSARSFIDDWNEASRRDDSFSFPPQNASTILYKDKSKRDSICRGCQLNITIESVRIVCLSRFSTPRPANGGMMVGRKFFYHEGCFADFTKKSSNTQDKCTNCGRFTARPNRIYARVSRSHYVSAMVCEDCRDKLGLCRCRHCGKECLPALLSPAVDVGAAPGFSPGIEHGDLTCDVCAENWDIVRLKEQAKIRKREQEIELRLLRIRELIIKNEFLAETSESEGNQPRQA